MPGIVNRKRRASGAVSKPKRKQPFTPSYMTKIPRNAVRLGSGFPKKMRQQMSYHDVFLMASNAGSTAERQFKLNGLFDPDVAIGGHQPLYFDQMMGIYNHFHVVGCKATVTAQPYDSNTSPAKIVIWQNDDTTNSSGTWNTRAEYPKASSGVTEGDNKLKFTLPWSAKGTFGGDILANNSLQGTASGDPTELSILQITVQSADNVSTTNTIIHVKLEYTVWFTEVKDILTS